MDKIKVLIADDHSLIRKGLEQLLELEGDIEVIGEASNGKMRWKKQYSLIRCDINGR